jgi:hypothetical protein
VGHPREEYPHAASTGSHKERLSRSGRTLRGASVSCLNYRLRLNGTRSPMSMSIMD